MLFYDSKCSSANDKLKEDSRFSHKHIPIPFPLDIMLICVWVT